MSFQLGSKALIQPFQRCLLWGLRAESATLQLSPLVSGGWAQSLANYCHPSFSWPRSNVLNLVFRGTSTTALCHRLVCLTVCFFLQMPVRLTMIQRGCNTSPTFWLQRFASLVKCHMTVKMASGAVFGGMLYENIICLLVKLWEPVWPSGKTVGW